MRIDTMANAFDPTSADRLGARERELVGRRAALLGPAYKLFYERPVELVRGSGVYVYDAEGNEYLDGYNNVPSVGHAHPRVTAAITEQSRTLNTHTRYLDSKILDYSERLIATHVEGLGNAMFTCTGSEANDLALRIAKYATGATGIIVTRNAYHGLTTAVAEFSPSLGVSVPLGAHVRTVAAPDIDAGDAGQVGEKFAAGVADAVADLERHGHKVACFIADTLFSTDGILPDPAGFLAPTVDVIHRAGGLYIADEVQPGFARTGDAMWGYQRHGIVPDIVTMGKPMGNGMPIAGLVARPALLEQFGNDIRYFNTFGGNTVCIAAAAAVLDVIESENLLANSQKMGALLKKGLEEIASRRPWLTRVRGAGLYVAADLADPKTGSPSPDLTKRVVNGLRDRRVLISSTRYPATTLKIRPLLPFSGGDVARMLDALESVAKEIDSSL